jgi:phenylpropionate dioxygenase-like ring-hydroxylating dioxygenase large terminal subunit
MTGMAIAEKPGEARSPGITYQQLLDEDTHPVPAILREERPEYLGDADIPIGRYISREFHDLEKERLWSRVWQFACREEHIPEVGDTYVYEIAGQSYVIVRSGPDKISAFPNACLHRGRQLRDYEGNCTELRCPFHGFAWTLDGELADVPGRWDFPHIRDEEWHLPEVKVGTWEGFVMINPDPAAEPLEDFLGSIGEHFLRWDLESRYVQAHVTKIIEANWKVTQEAFCEAYHVSGTHPQGLPYLGDTNTQVDVWENHARAITPGGTPSPQLDWEPTEDEILRYSLDVRVDEEAYVTIGDGETARSASARRARDQWRPTVGDGVDTWCDAEFMDSIDYTVFPNFHPWGAYNRIVYRFRPNGDDHRTSIMEVLFLAPFTGERPPPASIHALGVDEPWTDAPELGMLGKIFQQDTFNMAKVQLGLESTRKPGVTLGNYMESKIRWLHTKLGEWVDESPVVVNRG